MHRQMTAARGSKMSSSRSYKRRGMGGPMVVMGDMNARVGCDTSLWGEVLGRNGEEVCNDNGR